jgi:hypothetical protein
MSNKKSKLSNKIIPIPTSLGSRHSYGLSRIVRRRKLLHFSHEDSSHSLFVGQFLFSPRALPSFLPLPFLPRNPLIVGGPCLWPLNTAQPQTFWFGPGQSTLTNYNELWGVTWWLVSWFTPQLYCISSCPYLSLCFGWKMICIQLQLNRLWMLRMLVLLGNWLVAPLYLFFSGNQCPLIAHLVYSGGHRFRNFIGN